jgi:predicted MFS family arabinose efflux permease
MRSAPWVVGISLFLVTTAVNLQVPLYGPFAEAAGITHGLTTLVFACYVAGLLPVVIFLGGISDVLGRKPILLLSLVLALLATLVASAAPGLPAFVVARVLQGLALGFGMGTGTAYLAELLEGPGAPRRAAAIVAVTTSLGFGSGALLTSLALLAWKGPVPASHPLVLLGTSACLIAACFLPSLRPIGGTMWRLPAFPVGTLPLGLALGTAWATTGLVIAVLPAQLAVHGQGVWVGMVLFLVNGVGALFQPVARRMSSLRSLYLGLVLLPAGYGLLVTGAANGSLPLVLGGAAIAGASCYGFIYVGGLASVAEAAGLDRARAVSGFFLCGYLGFCLPAVAVGALADAIGLVPALLAFGGVIVGSCGLVGVVAARGGKAFRGPSTD